MRSSSSLLQGAETQRKTETRTPPCSSMTDWTCWRTLCSQTSLSLKPSAAYGKHAADEHFLDLSRCYGSESNCLSFVFPSSAPLVELLVLPPSLQTLFIMCLDCGREPENNHRIHAGRTSWPPDSQLEPSCCEAAVLTATD